MPLPQPTRSAIDHVQITADNTNVTSGRLKPPIWAKRVYIQLSAIDNDWTYSVSVGGVELARDSAPDRSQAGNLASADFVNGSYITSMIAGPETEILINVNVVTGADGMVYIMYTS